VIRVALNRRDAGFCLSVEDEGVGFRSDTAKTGIGGRLLNVFGQQVNGHVSIKSELGGGTKVELTFPDFLEPKQESANAGPIRAHA
jgi:signal transduction histidine kinase